jgi:hypothetical protein
MSDSMMGGAPDTAALSEAFGVLGNEIRLGILLALWGAYDPYASEAGVPFSTLRERVGMRDPGQFNYYLSKLEGTFVARTGEGYMLQPAGLGLIQTVIAGVGQDASLEPTDAGIDCHHCGAPMELGYDDGWLHHCCTECAGGFGDIAAQPEGVLFAEPFPPAALAGRSPEGVFATGGSACCGRSRRRQAGSVRPVRALSRRPSTSATTTGPVAHTARPAATRRRCGSGGSVRSASTAAGARPPPP